MNVASTFLSCNIGSLPFNFLGVMVGDNPRRSSVWKEVISNYRRKLASWRGRFLSLVGRVILINSVLNVVPIYALSFYKMPQKVMKVLRRIQSDFLWKGSESSCSIHWVSWKEVCKPKEEGGIGIKDMENFNRDLLSKWKWRIINEKEAIWNRIVCHRYITPKLKLLSSNDRDISKGYSIWWRDLVQLDSKTEGLAHTFSNSLSCRLKDGDHIPFWCSSWLGNQQLNEAFPKLHAMAIDRFMSVEEAGYQEEGQWS